MTFRLITAGWECADVLEQTLQSIDDQACRNFTVHIVDDASGPEQQKLIQQWCEDHGDQWTYHFNEENYGAVRSQYEGVRRMNPEDEDVIVFIDLDGDRLAHPKVLDRLVYYYSDPNVWVTYGNYRPQPDLTPHVPTPVSSYPPDVVANNSYRRNNFIEGTRYNHLRTVKWKVLKNIPLNYFQYPNGEWLYSPTDLIVMMGALELAGGKYKCIKEMLLLYNAQQPHPDNVRNLGKNVKGTTYTASLPPLQPLKDFDV